MVRTKRKHASSPPSTFLLSDPYRIHFPPCHIQNHHRKQRKTKITLIQKRNCMKNPNCLYGLGEYQTGIWQGQKFIQRVLGVDPRARQRDCRALNLQLCGLRNLGATCYLNSMLQCFFHNVAFRQAVYDWEPKVMETQVENRDHLRQIRALQHLFAQMQLGTKRYYDPTEFASTLALNNVMQQDAQEFSKLLLTHLRTIFEQSRFSSHWNLVDRIFQGQMNYVTKCLKCTKKSMRPSFYYEISLNIKGHKSIKDCITSYLAAEVLEGENKYFCEHCDSKQCAERFLELKPQAMPSTLMIQLMRFVYDVNAGRKKKLTDIIEIDETLNMTELLRCSGHAEAFEESNDAIYRLQGYPNHRGKSAHVGHYTASIALPKPRISGGGDDPEVVWFEFDDAVVSDLAKSEAVSEHSHGKRVICSRDMYMLLYVRDDRVSDEITGSTISAHNSATSEIPLPAEMCRKEVETQNMAFNVEVEEYVSKANGMKARIQERLNAYKHFFEQSHPYPDSSAPCFYWVDAEWLRRWVTGEEYDSSASMSSHSSRITGEAFETKPLSNGKMLNMTAVDKLKSQNCDDDINMILDPIDVKTANANEHTCVDGDTTNRSECADNGRMSQTHYNDNDVNMIGDTTVSGSPRLLPLGTDAENDTRGTTVLRGDEIPFSKPVDVARFSCAHSSDLDVKANGSKEFAQPTLCFAPDNVTKLKRISAKLFAYLKANCSVESKVGEALAPGTSAQMRVFEAPTYRCTICEKEFCHKVLNDVDRLKEIHKELELLKGTPASVAAVVAAGNFFLMSRAWIKSYKNYLQLLLKELSHVAVTSKKGRKSLQSMDLNDCFAVSREGSINGNDVKSTTHDGLESWQKPINEDITCVHSNLTLEKRTYRPVSAETWKHFSAKFPYRAEYAESAMRPCPQCEDDNMTSKMCIQIERDVRDDILSDAALSSLYRRKPRQGYMRLRDVFELLATQRGSRLENASSSWTAPDATQDKPQRMFLVSRRWLAQWREYIRNVEEVSPLSLTMSPVLCAHQKLVLPSDLLAAQRGQLVDASLLEVEFVSQDEMQALGERYGNPEMPLYYGLLVATGTLGSGEEELQVIWQKCLLCSLKFGNEQVVYSKGCSDGVDSFTCQDANDEDVICAECQAISDQTYRDGLENFMNRVVNIQQLKDDQVVQTSKITLDASSFGRRRSRRSRPGSVCTCTVTTNATDTVYILKAKIYAELDTLPLRQRLYYKGVVLDDHCTLKQCGIKAGDTVFMQLLTENTDDHVMDETSEREVGFADSVFHSVRQHTRKKTLNEVLTTSGDQGVGMDRIRYEKEVQVWVCPACTFINDDSYCEMCWTTKDDMKA